MITAYHRPQNLDEAIRLITRKSPRTYPLGGGTLLSREREDDIEVVDLQALGLSGIDASGRTLKIGATATLEQVMTDGQVPAAVRAAIKLEAPLNLRNSATSAGTIVACDGRSTFVTALLALDARVGIRNPSANLTGIGEFLPLRQQALPGALITDIQIPLGAQLAFEYVSRTPADKPIVCVCLAKWPAGRTRLAVGGWGSSPHLAMDGTEDAGAETAARNACHDASDPWGSAEYRMDAAATLARRCLASIESA